MLRGITFSGRVSCPRQRYMRKHACGTRAPGTARQRPRALLRLQAEVRMEVVPGSGPQPPRVISMLIRAGRGFYCFPGARNLSI